MTLEQCFPGLCLCVYQQPVLKRVSFRHLTCRRGRRRRAARGDSVGPDAAQSRMVSLSRCIRRKHRTLLGVITSVAKIEKHSVSKENKPQIFPVARSQNPRTDLSPKRQH